jgi:hypothetical protein
MNFDFQSIKTELQNRLSLLSGWKTTLYFGVYDRITDAYAYVMAKVAYVAEYRYRESFWRTAQAIQSLLRMAWLLGYKAYRKKGAVGFIKVSGSPTFDPSYVNPYPNITLTRWMRITDTTKQNNVYVTADTTYYTSTLGSFPIPVKEGIPKQYIYTAIGLQNEVITLYSPNIDNDEMQIYVLDPNGGVVGNVYITRNIYFINDLVNYYCQVDNAEDFQSVTLKFGDGMQSRMLTAGTSILIKYAITGGVSGNITSTGVLTTCLDTVYDQSGTPVSYLYFTNTSAIENGSEYEDIESIRNNAPALFGSGYRCGTISDWISILESYSYIYKAVVWTINEIGGSTLLSEQNKVFLSIISSDGNVLTTDEKTILTTDLYLNYASRTEIITFQDFVKVYPVFTIAADVTGVDTAVMSQTIKETLYNTYSTLSVDFATNIYQSQFIGTISNITGMVFHQTTMQVMEEGFSASQISASPVLYYPTTVPSDPDAVYITVNSPQLWIKRKIGGVWGTPFQVGVAHTGGNYFDGVNSYVIGLANSSINYATNTMSWIIYEPGGATPISSDITWGTLNPPESDGTGYVVSLIYITQDGAGNQAQTIRIHKNNVITDVDTSYIYPTLSLV